jgi:hypothetical protein
MSKEYISINDILSNVEAIKLKICHSFLNNEYFLINLINKAIRVIFKIKDLNNNIHSTNLIIIDLLLLLFLLSNILNLLINSAFVYLFKFGVKFL